MTSIPVKQFANREDELRFVASKLTAIQSRRHNFDFILAVSGVAGIGKTTLLEQVELAALARQIPVYWFGFNTPEARQDYVIYISQQLIDLFPDPKLQDLRENYIINRMADDVLSHHIQQFVQGIVQALYSFFEQQPMVWLFDDGHLMSREARELIEAILTEVATDQRLLVVVSGRDTIRWDNFELRRRTRPLSLASLPKEAAAQLAPDVQFAPLTDQVYTLTRGYPKASVLAYDWIAANLKLDEPNLADQLKSHEAELIFALFSTIFEQHILGDIQDRDRISQMLRYLSPLRRFDDLLLSILLPQIDAAMFGNLNTLHARALTRQAAVKTHLITWDSGRMAYSIEAPVRQLLYMEMQYRNQSRLRQIHQIMLDWYQQTIEEALQKDSSAPQTVIYFLEYLYHFIQQKQLSGQPLSVTSQAVQEKVTQQLSHYQARERNHFLEELQRDDEIGELLADDYPSLVTYVSQMTETGS